MALRRSRDRGRISKRKSSLRKRPAKGFRFNYEERSVKKLKERANRSGGSFDKYIVDGVPLFKPRAGDNSIRILPPGWEGADHFGFDIYLHYGIGADQTAYLCPAKMKGEHCPICEARNNIDDDEARRALSPSRRVLVYLIDRDDEAAGPQLWSMPDTVDKDISSRCVSKKTHKIILLDSPDNGYDVDFVREGEKLRTKYKAIDISRDRTPISDDEDIQEEWLQYIVDNAIPNVLIFKDYDYLESVFNATPHNRSSEIMPRRKAAETKKTSPARSKRTKTRRTREEDDIDDLEDELDERLNELEEEDEDFDEEDEDEDEDFDEEDEDFDEDEEDEDFDEEDEDFDEDEEDEDFDEDDEDEEDEPAPKKRGRGRPSTRKSTPAKTTAKRGRGRPRKVEEDEDEDDEPAPKRGRGRPRKQVEDEDDEPAPKRGRGRPRKETPAPKKTTRRRRTR